MALDRQQFPQLVRLTRRTQGMVQGELAAQVGISRSALSRYEQGAYKTLGDATIRKICAALSLEPPSWLAQVGVPTAPERVRQAGKTVLYYCPSPHCPMNEPFIVGDRIHFRPSVIASNPDSEVVCRFCEATMQHTCMGCGAPLVSGSCVCGSCGTSYLEPVTLDKCSSQVLAFNERAVPRVTSLPEEQPFWTPIDPGALRRMGELSGLTSASVPEGGEGDESNAE